MLDQNYLYDLAQEHKEQYQKNKPFPHIVIDNFLPEDIANHIHDSFPKFETCDHKTYQKEENKIATRPNVPGFPEELKSPLYALNSHEIITFLENLTGINGIVADPHFFGAGCQQTKKTGKLGIHVDFNWNKHLKLDRRMNMLIYLNKDWQDAWGGHLELWEKDMSACAHKIAPIFNRCVIFNTTDDSYHGLPDPMNCPEDVTRKSIILYFYTNGRTDGAKEVSWTQHQKRPGDVEDYKFKKKELELSS